MHDLIDDRFAIGTALRAIAVPAFEWSAVGRRMDARPVPRRTVSIVARPALVMAALLLALGTFVVRTPALMAQVEAGCLGALHAMGVGADLPPVPASVIAASRPMKTTLAAARQRANFTVVAPTGLPGDVMDTATFIGPISVWSRTARAWSTHGEELTFWYDRSGGRTFNVVAEGYDPSNFPAPR